MTLSNKDIFTNIYINRLWGKDCESVSGPGSTVEESKSIINALPGLFKKYNIKTVFDASCGDFNWMQHVDLSEIEYIGGDIVEEIIKDNEKYKKDNIDFIVMDILKDPFPKYDLIILKDVLFHFSNSNIHKTINSIKKSKSRFLLTTTFAFEQHESGTNIDIEDGDWKYLNLEIEPFNFPPPLERIWTTPWISGQQDKTLSLWKIDEI